MSVKFLDYTETPGEKHLGIVTIQATGTFRFKYKMNAGKNGGSFPNPPSFKIGEEYKSCIVPESNFMVEDIEDCIKSGVANSKPKDSSYSQASQNPLAANPFKSTYVSTATQEEIPF